jgi:hypothetical protein
VYKAKPPKRLSDCTSLSDALKENRVMASKAHTTTIDLIFIGTILKFLLNIEVNVFF